MKKKKKGLSLILIVIIILIVFILIKSIFNKEENKKMIDLKGLTIAEVKKFSKENKLKLNIEYTYNKEIEKNKIIEQNIKENSIIKENDKLNIVVSKGRRSIEDYKNDNINELGEVPIMMYHGIENIEETKYVGGNIDKDGYNRTANAFKNDLEFYYNEGYRMIRLYDYVNGNIKTEYGKSPIILTFDDGNKNNFNVTGLDENGNIIIDPNCAIGILEEFKKKYKDFNVTATFFVMDELFNQDEYDEKKLKWLVDNGYDVGNHTKNHINFSKSSPQESEYAVGYMYDKLNNIIPDKYVNIIALPYGSPGSNTHDNFQYILNGKYNDKDYQTISTLRVGWTSEISPFDKNFDKTFLKRIRAYDNNGLDFDIQYTFNILKNTKYISDGDSDTIVIPNNKESNLAESNKEIIKY